MLAAAPAAGRGRDVAGGLMALLTRAKEYSVGVVVLDAEHRHLFGLINELYEAILAGHSDEVLDKVFGELVAYTDYHFGNEEKLFGQTGYPEAEAHHAQHVELKRQMLAFRRDLHRMDSAILAIEVAKFLKGWILDHIQIEDKRYSAFLNANGIR